MKKWETPLIAENIAPKNALRLTVSHGDTPICFIRISKLRPINLGLKLYSFGALSDVHVTNTTFAMNKFQSALQFFNNTEKVAFTCISGDLTSNGTAEQFATYRNARDTYSDTEVYDCTGNHDVENTDIAPFLTKESTQPYIGRDLYYSFEQGNDIFIMFGMSGWQGKTGEIFTVEALQWLYETLEANRNRRVFVFEHCPSMVYENGAVVKEDSSGKPYNKTTSGAVIGLPLPTGNLLNQGSTSRPFRELMAHYKNVIWFHGHSHMDFKYQEQCSQVNYDKNFGCHSVHIPSSASGRSLKADGSGWENPTGSYGYVVDVYRNDIVLRGYDFANDEFAVIATYRLDTTPVEIPAKTFVDSTGTITT